jgi:hypothetical protein
MRVEIVPVGLFDDSARLTVPLYVLSYENSPMLPGCARLVPCIAPAASRSCTGSASKKVSGLPRVKAKESEPLARVLLGDSVYNSIAARSGVPGGLGHDFYEKWRVLDPNSSAAASIAEQSRAYYDAVRRANGY